MTPPPVLSVVLACATPHRSLRKPLEALARSLKGLESEIIVVHPLGAPPDTERATQNHPPVHVVPSRAALVPQLWAAGYRRAAGAVVAFTIDDCAVTTGWARGLLSTLERGAVGVGGPMVLPPHAGVSARAIYFLRYSAFLPAAPAGERADIPGDNAAYRKAALDRHAGSFRDGFWEIDFHHRVRAEGERLELTNDATALCEPGLPYLRMLVQRFRHARHFGAYRVAVLGHARGRCLLAAPLVPVVLLSRIARRARAAGMTTSFLTALPATVPLATAWALGEVAGALLGPPRDVAPRE